MQHIGRDHRQKLPATIAAQRASFGAALSNCGENPEADSTGCEPQRSRRFRIGTRTNSADARSLRALYDPRGRRRKRWWHSLGGALLLALLALDFDDRLDFSPTQPLMIASHSSISSSKTPLNL